jgi:hypothetical protein
MADRFVLGENHSGASARFVEPDLVGSVLWEVIGMDLDLGSGCAQGLRDGKPPEVAIDEEDRRGPLTRRRGLARSG